MKFHPSCFLAVTVGLFASLSTASAHFNITGNRTLNAGNPIDGLTVNENGRTVSSSFGWADATDANWGDSHRITSFKFTLTSTQTVSITIARNFQGTGPADTLLPAFSLFTTTAYVGDGHDTSTASRAYLNTFATTAVGESFVNTNGNGVNTVASHGVWETGDPFMDTNTNGVWDVGEQFTDSNGTGVWEFGDAFTDSNGNGVFDGAGISRSGKEGVFRALAPWRIFQDSIAGTEVIFDTIIGHAADGTAANFGSADGIIGDGTADGTVSATFADLAPGDYYMVVGGANYAAQNSADVIAGTGFRTYGVNVTVSAVPEPTSGALLVLSAAGLAVIRRRLA